MKMLVHTLMCKVIILYTVYKISVFKVIFYTDFRMDVLMHYFQHIKCKKKYIYMFLESVDYSDFQKSLAL